jgi:hypothetical protein
VADQRLDGTGSSTCAAALGRVLSGAAPGSTAFVVADIAVHEHDIRSALGAGGARGSATVDDALQTGMLALDRRLRSHGLGALEVNGGESSWLLGARPGSGTGATVAAEPFELFRALFGRRSPAQVARFSWTGDSQPYIARFSAFGMPARDLVE